MTSLAAARRPRETTLVDDILADLPPLLTIDETAELLRIHVRTLHRMLADGRLRGLRHSELRGSRHLIPRAELSRYLRSLTA